MMTLTFKIFFSKVEVMVLSIVAYILFFFRVERLYMYKH